MKKLAIFLLIQLFLTGLLSAQTVTFDPPDKSNIAVGSTITITNGYPGTSIGTLFLAEEEEPVNTFVVPQGVSTVTLPNDPALIGHVFVIAVSEGTELVGIASYRMVGNN